MIISAVSCNTQNRIINKKNISPAVTCPIQSKTDFEQNLLKPASQALKSYFLGSQGLSFCGTSGFKIKKLENVPCPCCGQVMLTPQSTERHVKRLNMAKGNKLADRIEKEEAPFLRSNERTVAFMAASAARGTELNLSGAIKKAAQNLPERFTSYCQDVLMNAAIICDEELGENSKAGNYLLKKAESMQSPEGFYRPDLTEDMKQFKTEMTEKQYHKIEDTLMTLPLDYKNVKKIMDPAVKEGSTLIAQRLFAPSLATAEHVHPHSLGGSNKASNFLSECAGCNNPRSSMSYLEWLKVHPEFKRNAQNYIEHVEGRIVNGELPETYDSYPVDIKSTLTKESEGHITMKVLDKAKLQELREAKKNGAEVDIHAETEKSSQDENQE